jgi:protein-tyrosine phosphatase
MDDGSASLEESLAMLELLKRQGVDTVIATPHFYANEESVQEFLDRRKARFDELCQSIAESNTCILCGAEVKFYPGISRMEGLELLAIEGTNLLLLEMPFAKWSDHTLRELYELANMRGLKIVIAHVERYLSMQNKDVLNELSERGLLVQVNASFFSRISTKKKAIKLLGAGFIQFIGSDCHNMTTRPPKLDSAYELIQRKFGEEFFKHMNEYGYKALGHKA